MGDKRIINEPRLDLELGIHKTVSSAFLTECVYEQTSD